MLHIFGNCNLVQNIWSVVKNFLIICGITLPCNAREIIIGISGSYIENQNTIHHILLHNSKMFRCRCKGEIPHLHGGLAYLK